MYLFVGILGSILCILALGITLFKSEFGGSSEYKLLNFGGGLCLLYYAVITNSVPFIILEGVWTLLSLTSFVRSCLTKTKAN